MGGLLLNRFCHWLAPESLSHYRRCVITQGRASKLWHSSCGEIRSVGADPRSDRAVTCARRCESRHNARKSPRPRERREGPLNRRFLGVVPRERARERARERERERERALINNNTALRSRFYRIQFRAAASVRKRWALTFLIFTDICLFGLRDLHRKRAVSVYLFIYLFSKRAESSLLQWGDEASLCRSATVAAGQDIFATPVSGKHARGHRLFQCKQRRKCVCMCVCVLSCACVLCAHWPHSLTHHGHFWQTVFLLSHPPAGCEDFLFGFPPLLLSPRLLFHTSRCWMPLRKWGAFPLDSTLGAVRTSSGRSAEGASLGDVRSFRYPGAHPAQRAAAAARPGGPVQPGTPAGERPRRRGQPAETRTEGTQAGSDRSDQERWAERYLSMSVFPSIPHPHKMLHHCSYITHCYSAFSDLMTFTPIWTRHTASDTTSENSSGKLRSAQRWNFALKSFLRRLFQFSSNTRGSFLQITTRDYWAIVLRSPTFRWLGEASGNMTSSKPQQWSSREWDGLW